MSRGAPSHIGGPGGPGPRMPHPNQGPNQGPHQGPHQGHHQGPHQESHQGHHQGPYQGPHQGPHPGPPMPQRGPPGGPGPRGPPGGPMGGPEHHPRPMGPGPGMAPERGPRPSSGPDGFQAQPRVSSFTVFLCNHQYRCQKNIVHDCFDVGRDLLLEQPMALTHKVPCQDSPKVMLGSRHCHRAWALSRGHLIHIPDFPQGVPCQAHRVQHTHPCMLVCIHSNSSCISGQTVPWHSRKLSVLLLVTV